MRIIYTLISSLLLILNHIELSSQFDHLPDGSPIPGISRPGTPGSADIRQSSGRLNHPVWSPSSSEPSLRARSRSPPLKRSLLRLYECNPDELRFVRLVAKAYPNRRFEIRKYTFPRDGPIQLKTARGELETTPSGEQTVLSTANGDVVAIVQDNKLLRGIYTLLPYQRSFYEKRVKINMNSGAVKAMTPEEIRECPLGSKKPISMNFEIMVTDDFNL